MFTKTARAPAIVITDLNAPPEELRIGFRLWERAILALTPVGFFTPMISCLAGGRAGWSALALPVAIATPVWIVARCNARETAPVTPQPVPGWSATWDEYDGTVIVGQEAA